MSLNIKHWLMRTATDMSERIEVPFVYCQNYYNISIVKNISEEQIPIKNNSEDYMKLRSFYYTKLAYGPYVKAGKQYES